MDKLAPQDLRPTLERLREEGVCELGLGTFDVLWEAADGRLHSSMGCWGATTTRHVTPEELVELDVTEQHCNCGGWSRSRQSWLLRRARSVYAHTSEDPDVSVAEAESWAEVARLLKVRTDPSLRVDGLDSLWVSMQTTLDREIARLCGVLDVGALWEAAAAQVARIAVTAREGVNLQTWASSKLIDQHSKQRYWLDQQFDDELRVLLAASPQQQYLVAVPHGAQTAHTLLVASCDDVIEKGCWVFGVAMLPTLVANGLKTLRGECVPLEAGDVPQAWRVAIGLWNRFGSISELTEALVIARAACAAPRVL
jgi:hypothetical protein